MNFSVNWIPMILYYVDIHAQANHELWAQIWREERTGTWTWWPFWWHISVYFQLTSFVVVFLICNVCYLCSFLSLHRKRIFLEINILSILGDLERNHVPGATNVIKDAHEAFYCSPRPNLSTFCFLDSTAERINHGIQKHFQSLLVTRSS